MNRNKYIALLLLAGIMVIGVFFLWRGTGTFYHGHRLSWWVDQYCNLDNPRRVQAKAALSAIGTNSVPYLMNLIGNVDAKPSSALSSADQEDFRTRMWQQAWSAAAVFSVLGTNAKPYIPELKALAADPSNGDTCVVAESALVQMGPDGFAAALDVIAKPILRQRGVLMQSSGLFEHILPPWPPHLYQDPNFRINAIRAAPILLKCLGDNDVIVRNSAFSMLSYSDSGVMVPALTNFLASSPPRAIRRQATEALAKHGRDARVAVTFLLSRCSNSNPEIRIEASNALVEIAPNVLAR